MTSSLASSSHLTPLTSPGASSRARSLRCSTHRRRARATSSSANNSCNTKEDVCEGDCDWASTAGAGLEKAGAELAAAAAVLGENQVLTENPAALSMIACGLANAGRALTAGTPSPILVINLFCFSGFFFFPPNSSVYNRHHTFITTFAKVHLQRFSNPISEYYVACA